MPTEPCSLEHAQREAAAIIESDAVSLRTRDAILTAIELAAGAEVTVDHCRSAAKIYRAKLKLVAAAHGYVQCLTCGQFVHVASEVDADDPAACAHTLDIESDEMQAVLAVRLIFGGRVRQSLALGSGYSERQKLTARERSSHAQRPDQSPKGD